MWLVTADGSVDCMADPGEQEANVEHLHYCEVLTALSVLNDGGTFVVKMFTFFEDSTISLLYLLNCSFAEVNVFKPSSSKSGNSEVYVICLRFKGLQVLSHIWESLLLPYKSLDYKTGKSLFDLNEINSEYLAQMSACVDFYMEKQIETIEENIKSFKNNEATDRSKIGHRKKLVAAKYMKKYKVQAIAKEKRLVPSVENLNDLSYYFRQWNYSNGWSFFGDSMEFDTSCLDCNQKICDSLKIIMGKPLEKIVHSNFCSKENLKLNIVDFKSLDALCLPDALQPYIGSNASVLNIVDFLDKTKQYDFHSSFFYSVRNGLKQANQVFVKIPLVSSFLVGILYLLMFAYEKATFHKNGFIVLSKLSARVEEVKECFDIIDFALKDIGNTNKEINQIVPLNVMYNHVFINLVWNYNNVVCC